MPVLAQRSFFSRPHPISQRSSRRSQQGARSSGMEIPDFCYRNSEFSWFSRILLSIYPRFLQDCEAAFQQLKTLLTSAPILTQPDVTKPFDVYCDASGTGLGCVLMQEGKVV